MAVVEDAPSNENQFDDSCLLSCKFENHRIIKNYTEYIIKVQRGLNSTKVWTILRRYSEFVELDKSLHASAFDITLPPKKLVGNRQCQFILQRQEQLQKYMNKVLQNLVLSSSIHVKRFLDPENEYYSKNFEDTAFRYASMALRGKPLFHNLRPVFDVGWRYNKHYCKVKQLNESRRDYILTWISKYGVDICLKDKELQSVFKILSEISHQFIMPIVCSNCSTNGTLIIRPDCVEGSLRELIYDHSRFEDFISKCRYRRERLVMPEECVITIAVQVLHALMFLHEKNIPYGNLHSGNIFIVDNVAKITDVENSILGLWTFYKPYIIENRRIRSLQNLDVYCFGHVLYEMTFGERLQSVYLDKIPSECYDNLRPVTLSILSNSTEKLPSVPELFSTEAFKMFSKMDYRTKPRCKITSESQTLFEKCRASLEIRLRNEQVELRRLRKMKQMEEKVELEERNEHSRLKKEKRKMKKTKSQLSLKMNSSSDQCENISNSSTPTTLSADSGTPASVCDKVDAEKSPESRNEKIVPSETDDRSKFLQSILSFNRQKLKKVQSVEES